MADAADETFESADAGAAEVITMEAGQIRKGGYIVIKNRPCKVVSVSTSKTGKHGHAKSDAGVLYLREWQSVRFACESPGYISQVQLRRDRHLHGQEARGHRALDALHDGAQRLPL